jgi:hypothetical protein
MTALVTTGDPMVSLLIAGKSLSISMSFANDVIFSEQDGGCLNEFFGSLGASLLDITGSLI